ncbi:MAG: SCO family protein [Ignavibacteriaceae bacterium]
MKKYLIIISATVLLIAGYLIIGSNANKINASATIVENTTNAKDGVTKPPDDDCCKALNEGNFSSESIYQLKSKWTDQNGRKIVLGKFKNKNVVLAMFYASCQSACPVIVNNMKIIEAGIPRDKINNYRFVLVTIDPDRDTPANLLKYANERNLNTNTWNLLRGTKDDIMELSMMFGFKFTKNESGGFSHTNLISFLNKSGEIIHQNAGLDVDINSVSNVLASLNK